METARRSARGNRRRRSSSPTFGQLLTGAVESAADRVAVRFNPSGDPADQRQLTYSEFDQQSSRLARVLIARGIGPGDVVAIGIARGIESVLAVWAIAKTGAAYVPVDPNYPADRIAHIVSDSGAVLGLTTATHREVLGTALTWLELDDAETATHIAALPAHPISYTDRIRTLDERHPAYVIYTSGSTGKPKGVVVTHTGLAGLVAAERAHYRVAADSRVLHVCSPNFDVSVLELLLTFSAGATLVIAPPGVFGGFELADLLRREQVSHMLITPGALESVDPADLDDLQVVVVAGDKFGPELVGRWAVGEREFYNGYGPTEATILATSTPPMDPAAPVTIGAAIAGVGAFVLDSRLRPVPSGVIGELYLSGPALAQGYLNRPALTAERFVASPFGTESGDANARLYRTGDLVRRSESGDGVIEYMGRSDFQVKIRGFRIELGEIDNALTAHPDIDFAATLGKTLPSGVTALVSYVMPRSGATVEVAALDAFLAESLPGYMIPAAIMVLDRIPLTPVGKLDRKALPEPVFAVREFRAPATPVQQVIAGVFAELLTAGAPEEIRVGADDDFFELGGNSLLAAQAATRIGAALDTRVPVQLLFEVSTVSGLAERVERHIGTGSGQELVAQQRPDSIPLSFAQQRMWFLNQFDPASAVNNMPIAVRLSGALDVDALRVAVTDLVARHEVLRTMYPPVDGVGTQLVLPLSDPRAVPALAAGDATEDAIAALVTETVGAGFDVTVAPPLRLRLLRLSATEHVLVCVMHHIAGDGVSMGPLTRDLMTAYVQRSAGNAPGWPELAVQYVDFTLWQRAVLGTEDDPESILTQQIDFWRTQLAGVPDQLELPIDRPRPATASYRGASLDFRIPAQVHAGLDQLARTHNSTLFMVVHAALSALLARLSGSTDIAIGTPVAGRGDAALDDLIGMFVNTLVLRTEVDPAAGFDELLAQTRAVDVAAFGHADVPFERLVELLDPARSTARHPLFQVMLAFQNMARTALELPGLTVAGVELTMPFAKFDLQFEMVEDTDRHGAPHGIAVGLTYATDLFDADTIAGFADRFQRLLAGIVAAPAEPLGAIELLEPAELDRILVQWNDTRHDLAPELLLDGYRRAVACYPDAVAVAYEGAELTYREFDERVNRLARLLITQGVGPESLVGLAVRRSLELVVGMYAIVTAGGAYVPIDPDHPADRIAHILDTAAPAAVLSTTADAIEIPAGVPVILVDSVALEEFSAAPVELAEVVRPGNPAYVIFTSGSTGRPKGVAVSHAAIVNQMVYMGAEYGIGPSDVYLQKTPATFDVSLWGYFLPLRTGAKLVVSTHDGHRDPVYLAETIAAQSVTLTDFVPSMLSVFAAHTSAGSIPSLRAVFAAGEALPTETVADVARVCTARVHNLYGPTEAAVTVTRWPASDSDRGSVPMGVPEWNTRVYVLDSRLRAVPAGVVGELYLAGDQLARGYVARPGLTADRFVANPFEPGARMYRSGDLVRWGGSSAEPALEYLGRTDFQVKFRGQRIELGEIETALLAQDVISQSVALVLDTASGQHLVAYVVARPGEQPDPAELRTAVAESLPAYMVPTVVTVLDSFPLNPSGKLDRKALPAPAFTAGEFRAPGTPAEEIVAGVFAELLGMARVGADDDYFALGGNSLLATRAIARINEALDADLAIRDLFETPTVSALAARIGGASGATARPPLVATERPQRIPLSLAQQRMWVVNQVDPTSGSYNIPFAIRLTGELDVAALDAAVTDVLGRHESLRTFFPVAGGTVARGVAGRVDVDAQGEAVADRGASSDGVADIAVSAGSGRNEPGPARGSAGVDGVASGDAGRGQAGGDTAAGGVVVADGMPVQVILSAADALPGGLQVETTADILTRAAELAGAGFDVTREVPLRAALLTDGTSADWLLVVVVHHISADGASLAPLARDLMTAYVARAAQQSPGWAPLDVQYADFALWQRAVVGEDAQPESPAAAQLDYWRNQLADVPPLVELPQDRPRPSVPTLRGATTELRLPAEVHTALNHLAREHKSSLFMVVHAALAVLLGRLSGTSDIAIGTAVAGRGERALDELVGMFVNTLTLRTTLDPAGSFDEAVDVARETDLGAFANADLPFERVAEVVAPGRGSAQSPLFQVALTFSNNEAAALELPGLTVNALDTAVAAKFDLQVDVEPRFTAAGDPDELITLFNYATDLFDEATVRSIGARFARILTAVAADPQIRIGDIDILDESERARLLAGAAPAPAPSTPSGGTTLAQAFTAAAEDDPDGPALVWGDDALTYDQLDARSARLARLLIGRGFGPGDAVAVDLSRGIDWAVAVWAILKAGAAVVPVTGAELPAEPAAKLGITVGEPRGVDWISLDDPAIKTELSTQSARPVTYADRTRALRGGDPAFVGADGTRSYNELATAGAQVRADTDLTFEARTFGYGPADSFTALVEPVAAGVAGASMVLVPMANGSLSAGALARSVAQAVEGSSATSGGSVGQDAPASTGRDSVPGARAGVTAALAEEWVTHLFGDRAGLEALDTPELGDLQALIADDAAPGNPGAAEVVLVLGDLRAPTV
ncbi:amino acid adenylation domain-containing protein [Nocardia sp. IBHARD005]|uniref:amino acid adenylation domain-containing protein n=1 Tax=Nocardia sp. IBHARD005 TaxID=3457765 RepID=UPI004058B0B6